MKIYILSFFLFLSCLNNKSEENLTKVKSIDTKIKINKVQKKSIVSVNAESKNDTLIIILQKINCKLLDISYNDNEKRVLLIQKESVITHKINLLTQDDYDGFSINWIKDIGNGFEISTEFGKYYYERNFQFIYENNSFYLKKMVTKSIDYKNNNEEKESVKIMNSPVNIDNFDINDFIK